MLGLTLALYSHVAFCVYAGIYLLLEAAYYRDVRALLRLAAAGVFAVIVSLPVHWESLRYPAYRQLQQHRLRSRRADRLAALRTDHLLQRRDPGLATPLVQRLSQPDERLVAGAGGDGVRSRPLAGGFLRVRGRSDAGVAAPEHVGGRRAVRSHPAHDAAARGSRARRLRAALRRHAPAGAGARRRDRPLCGDVVRAGATRAGAAGVRSAADRSDCRVRRQHDPRRGQPASRH